jgi:uncharacterized spore protein YtfJ
MYPLIIKPRVRGVFLVAKLGRGDNLKNIENIHVLDIPDDEIRALPVEKKTGQTVENILKFMREACQEIFNKLGQKMANIHTDGEKNLQKG